MVDYHLLFDSTPGLYLVLDPSDYHILAASDGYLRATMTERQYILGRNIFEVFPDDPEDAEAEGVTNLRASLDRVRMHGKPDALPVVRYPVPRPADLGGGFEERYWSPINIPIYDDAGELRYILHRPEDVTEFVRLQAEARDVRALRQHTRQMEADILARGRELQRLNDELRDRDERFQRMFHGAAIGILTTNSNLIIEAANHSFAQMLEMADESLTGKDFKSLLDLSDRQRFPRDVEELLAGRRDSLVVDLRLTKHGGGQAWARASVTLQRTETEDVAGLVIIAEDITDRRRIEAELAAIETRLSRTLERMADGFYLLDDEWRFVYLNQVAEKVLRKPREALLGKVLWEVLPVARESDLWHEYHHAVAQDEPGEFEFYLADWDQWFHVNCYPSPEGLGVYFRDISQRVRLNRRLEKAQRLESIGQLTGGVAHDFNNLLTVILGNVEMLTDALSHGATDLHGMAEMIGRAAHRGADLTRRLLAVARRQPLEPQVVQVNELLEDMQPLLQRALGEQVELRLNLHEGLWEAMVDPAQLDSAVLNLCINARDAMPNGGQLMLETANKTLDASDADQYPDLLPGDYVLLSVTDTGNGINPAHLSRVFEPFFTTKDTSKGSGLGLAMVYGFVKQSKGHVNLVSEEGVGTKVLLYLPRATTLSVEQVTDKPVSTVPQGKAEVILLVEDDGLVREMVRDQLLSFGYQVLEAANGPEALDIARERRDIALLFTDVVMPGGMVGPELAHEVRKLHPNMPILFTSGYTEEAMIQKGRLGPGMQLLTKPYTRAELLRRIESALSTPLH
jgi:PAS domain S-box-containing protein